MDLIYSKPKSQSTLEAQLRAYSDLSEQDAQRLASETFNGGSQLFLVQVGPMLTRSDGRRHSGGWAHRLIVLVLVGQLRGRRVQVPGPARLLRSGSAADSQQRPSNPVEQYGRRHDQRLGGGRADSQRLEEGGIRAHSILTEFCPTLFVWWKGVSP